MTYPTNPDSARMKDNPPFMWLGPYAVEPAWGAPPGWLSTVELAQVYSPCPVDLSDPQADE